MNIKEIEDRAVQVVADVACREVDDIKLTTTLAEDLEMDEIDMDSVLIDLESEFEIDLDDEAMSKAKTVQDLINLVNTELNDAEHDEEDPADDEADEDEDDEEQGDSFGL